MLPTVRIPRPVLVSVAFMAGLVVLIVWFGKFRPMGGENVTAGNAPMPVSAMVCGVPGALSVIFTEAVRTPVVVGEKVTVMPHVAPGASVAGQGLDSA